MLKLFARDDGEAAVDRHMIAETLFRAAFDMLDKLSDDEKQAIARRVHAGSYDRLVGNAPVSNSDASGVISAASNTVGLKSPSPRPPK